MATGYKYQGTDLDDLLEPRGSFYAPNPDFVDYKINNSSMAGRFAAYNGRGWEKLFSSTYLYNGSPIRACQKGYKPSVNTRFYSINGKAGEFERNIYISRTDSQLSFTGDVTTYFGPSRFRNGKVPMAIGVIACAGGGGSTDVEKDKTDYTMGGGGGGIGWFVISFEGNPSIRLTLGGGGATNNNGGNTILYVNGTQIFYIDGGGSGSPSGSATQARGSGIVFRTTSNNIFSANGGVMTSSNKTDIHGCYGYATYNNATTDSCEALVSFDSSDSSVRYGVPYTSIPQNSGLGGGSLNGTMVAKGYGGTNGGGAGYGGSAGGGGAAYFFY